MEYVTFRYRDRAHGNTILEMNLDGVEFLRRFLLHVLPKAFAARLQMSARMAVVGNINNIVRRLDCDPRAF